MFSLKGSVSWLGPVLGQPQNAGLGEWMDPWVDGLRGLVQSLKELEQQGCRFTQQGLVHVLEWSTMPGCLWDASPLGAEEFS